MANKKITVVGDGAEQPLTPEEAHTIEVRVDQMLDPALPDEPVVEQTTTQATQPVPVEVEAVEPQKSEIPEVTVAAPTDAKPKVTKIVTTFADEPENDKQDGQDGRTTPVETPAEPVSKPEPIVAAPPKPVTKKITVKHHDDEDEVASESPKPAAKTSKTKHVAKKPSKKLRVAVADGPAPDDLAAKADAIAASALVAEEMIGAKAPVDTEEAVPEPSEPVEPAVDEAEPQGPEVPATETTNEPVDEVMAEGNSAPESAEAVPEELPETIEDQDDGAPPLILKHSVAPIGSDDSLATDPENPAEPADATGEPSETGETPIEIPVQEDEETTEDIPVEVKDTEQIEPVAGEAETVTSEEPTAAVADGEKKYRPPEGPIQFKRAEVPIQPLRPGEPRPQEEIDQLSEDEALARAFEAPKSSAKPEKKVRKVGSLLKIITWLVVLAVLAGVATVAAVPRLRHKALELVGLDASTKTTTTSQTKADVPAVTTPAPISQDIYIARRDAIYNVYRANADGQQEQLVLAGTGNEETTLVLAPNTDSSHAVLISTRDGKKTTTGELQESIVLMDASGGKPVTLDTADQIKLVDWFGSKVVYVLLGTSTSTSDPNRYQLISYDTTSMKRVVLDHMNFLNDVLSAKGRVYYATAASSTASGQFVAIKPDGTGKHVVLSAEVAAITRIGYDDLTLSTVSKWYAYHLGDSKATPTNNVGQAKSRLYIDSPDGKHSAYLTDTQLTVLDVAAGKETVIPVTSAEYPLRWLNNETVLYRSNKADYMVKSSGGTPVKIVDVSNVSGVSLWHDQ